MSRAEIELIQVACLCFLIIKITFYSIYIFLWYIVVLKMYTLDKQWPPNGLFIVPISLWSNPLPFFMALLVFSDSADGVKGIYWDSTLCTSHTETGTETQTGLPKLLQTLKVLLACCSLSCSEVENIDKDVHVCLICVLEPFWHKCLPFTLVLLTAVEKHKLDAGTLLRTSSFCTLSSFWEV